MDMPKTRHELLIAALRHANDVGDLLNHLSAEVFRLSSRGRDHRKYDHLHNMLRKRFNGNGVMLFIAADNLRVRLPRDLQGGESDQEL